MVHAVRHLPRPRPPPPAGPPAAAEQRVDGAGRGAAGALRHFRGPRTRARAGGGLGEAASAGRAGASGARARTSPGRGPSARPAAPSDRRAGSRLRPPVASAPSAALQARLPDARGSAEGAGRGRTPRSGEPRPRRRGRGVRPARFPPGCGPRRPPAEGPPPCCFAHLTRPPAGARLGATAGPQEAGPGPGGRTHGPPRALRGPGRVTPAPVPSGTCRVAAAASAPQGGRLGRVRRVNRQSPALLCRWEIRCPVSRGLQGSKEPLRIRGEGVCSVGDGVAATAARQMPRPPRSLGAGCPPRQKGRCRDAAGSWRRESLRCPGGPAVIPRLSAGAGRGEEP